MGVLSILKNPELRLSKSARKVAEIVLADPEGVIRAPIASIARKAGVSEPTVNRFCHSLNCTGFPDFKVKLAQELAQEVPRMTRDVDPGDPITTLVDKIFDATHASLQQCQKTCEPTRIELATDMLARAGNIMFCGLGASGPVAMDAQHKFLRLNIPVVAHTDMINQRMCAAAAGNTCVMVCISFTGRTVAVVEAARIARLNGARVIGITSANSPLADACNLTLTVDTPEDTDIYTPMSSRIAHLVLIDILATAVALKQGPRFSQTMKKVKESLRDTRYGRTFGETEGINVS